MLTTTLRSVGLVVAALAGFVLAGCGGDAAVPTPTAPTVPTFQLSGKVVDASAGINLVGVTITAVDGPNAGMQATTGGDGRYTLQNLQGGSFTLRARLANYEDHVQAVSFTTHTTIDLRMIPGRSVNSGWTGGEFQVTLDGARISTRVTTAQVTQTGAIIKGQFTGADGSSGTFSGQLAGTLFTGSLKVEIASGASGRCRGSAGVTGTATGGSVEMTAFAVPLENCSGPATALSLTLTP